MTDTVCASNAGRARTDLDESLSAEEDARGVVDSPFHRRARSLRLDTATTAQEVRLPFERWPRHDCLYIARVRRRAWSRLSVSHCMSAARPSLCACRVQSAPAPSWTVARLFAVRPCTASVLCNERARAAMGTRCMPDVARVHTLVFGSPPCSLYKTVATHL